MAQQVEHCRQHVAGEGRGQTRLELLLRGVTFDLALSGVTVAQQREPQVVEDSHKRAHIRRAEAIADCVCGLQLNNFHTASPLMTLLYGKICHSKRFNSNYLLRAATCILWPSWISYLFSCRCSLLSLTDSLWRFCRCSKMDYPNQWRKAAFQPVVCHRMFWMVC